MQKKIFWLTFAGLGLVVDFALPFWWRWLRHFLSLRFPGGLRIGQIGSESRMALRALPVTAQ